MYQIIRLVLDDNSDIVARTLQPLYELKTTQPQWPVTKPQSGNVGGRAIARSAVSFCG